MVSKAVNYVLQKNGIKATFVSRVSKENSLTYSQLTEDILNDNLLIVNASPVGTFPNVNDCPDIPYRFLCKKHFLYDLVYNPAETLFLKKGKEHGTQFLNGESMLITQALVSWEIWNAC